MNNAEILIIDDEAAIRKLLEITLESNDYAVIHAATAKEGVVAAANHPPDLIILDLGLPDESGHSVLIQLREWFTNPIIILSALTNEEDIVKALDNGANDYLVKPFEFEELIARIKALIKRAKSTPELQISLKVANLELNSDSKTVTRNNVHIELTVKEFLLLEYLMRNKGKVLSRSDIAEKIWDISFDTGTNVIDLYIFYLRKKMYFCIILQI